MRAVVWVMRDVLWCPLRLPFPLDTKLAMGRVIVRLDKPLRRYLNRRS
jgi:hypothetical protein